MDIIIFNIVVAIAIAATVLIVSNKLILNRAIRKFIIPDLARGDFKLDNIKPAGLFSTGQFKKERIHLRPFTRGYPVYSKYFNLDYSSLKDKNKKLQVTARISVFLFIIYKVEYSHALELGMSKAVQ